MDEVEWLTSGSPRSMFRHFQTLGLSERKLWLIFFNHEFISLSFAPRDCDSEEARERTLIRAKCEAGLLFADGLLDWRAVYAARHPAEDISGFDGHRCAIDSVREEFDCRDNAWFDDAARTMCDMVRDVLGNPWRKPTWHCRYCQTKDIPGYWTACPNMPCGAPCWWRTPEVLSLASAAYKDRSCPSCLGTGKCRRYNPKRRHWLTDGPCPRCGGTCKIAALYNDRLSILADALEDANCDDHDVVMHLRGFVLHHVDPEYRPGLTEWRNRGGPHYRGFHALDTVLGKD